MKTAVFIERDAILNEVKAGPRQQISPCLVEEFKVIGDHVAPIQALKDSGLLLIATTNQPRVSRGSITRRELHRMHDILRRTFPLDDIILCAHDEGDRCPCRKPKPGLLIESAFKWKLDLDRSYVISDKWQDAEAARTAGCTSLLIQSPWVGPVHHDFLLPDLASVVAKILHLKGATTAGAVKKAAPAAKRGVVVG